jgi:hypothetical protein
MRALLKYRGTQATTFGSLCALDPKHVSRAQTSWIEEFDRHSQAGKRNDDSILWERGFMSATLPEEVPAPRGHVVLSSNGIEGIIVISPDPKMSRTDPDASLLYVRYLATAPWNREGGIPEIGFLGIGRLLVARAVLDSVASGHNGRLGLHSLPTASPFYGAIGFDSLGADPAQRGMTLYELRPQSANLVLAELGAHLVHDPKVL